MRRTQLTLESLLCGRPTARQDSRAHNATHDALPERTASQGSQSLLYSLAPRTHETRESTQLLGKEGLDLLPNTPRKNGRFTPRTHRDNDGGAVDYGGKDECRQGGVVDDIDGGFACLWRLGGGCVGVVFVC